LADKAPKMSDQLWSPFNFLPKSIFHGTPVPANRCPSGKYFYLPPTTTAPACAIVLADAEDAHPGRCVLRVSGSVEYLTTDQFDNEMKQDYNTLFAYVMKDGLKKLSDDQKAARAAIAAAKAKAWAASQPASQPATMPAK
jgi:hypothetical protein